MATIQTNAEPPGIVPGVSPAIYSEADFRRIAALIYRETGILLTETKRMLAYSRLAPLVRRSGLTSFAAYLDALEKAPEQMPEVVAALTTNHTYFHREPHHYEHFADTVRPDLIARARRGEAVRLWSAGCSTGEEVWTLLMVLLGADRAAGEQIAGRDIVALASDISTAAIAGAQAATYPAAALEAVPEPLRRQWSEADNSGHEPQLKIAPMLRAMVRFRQLNLHGEWPMRGQFDVIFCRNVMIYFDTPTKERLIERLACQLRPGGHLYIGHSERVTGAGTALLDPAGPTIYRRSMA